MRTIVTILKNFTPYSKVFSKLAVIYFVLILEGVLR